MKAKDQLLQLFRSMDFSSIQLGLQFLESVEELAPLREELLPTPAEQAILDEQFFGRRWKEPPMKQGLWLFFLTSIEVKQRNVFFSCQGKRYFIQNDLDFSLVLRYAYNLRQLELNHCRQEHILELLVTYEPPLKTLILDNLGIEEIPATINLLHSLEALSISNNQLKTLPTSFFELTRLKFLSLDDNALCVIAPQINALQDLLRLSLNGNQLAGLPETLRELLALKELYIRNNPLDILPEWLLGLDDCIVEVDELPT
ncbi:MAG: leucine-rich repeat domain-containing protein [Aureispira sp.]